MHDEEIGDYVVVFERDPVSYHAKTYIQASDLSVGRIIEFPTDWRSWRDMDLRACRVALKRFKRRREIKATGEGGLLHGTEKSHLPGAI